MFHHTRSAIALSLIAAFVITGCRFNPQAAQKVAERSHATAQAASSANDTGAKADAAVAVAATSVPVQAAPTSAPVTSAPAVEPTAVVAAQAEAPASAAPAAQSNKALLPAVSNAAAAAPAGDAPVAAAVPAADVPAVAPASASVTTPKKIVRPVVRAQPKVVSQRPKRTPVRVVRPKVTVVRKAPVVRRSLARVGCVIAGNISVNRRKSSSLSAGILGRMAPRTRFVALARSKTGRWLFGISRGRTGWVAASTLSCGADTRRLTVRAR